MRYHLRTLFILIGILAGFLAGRASILPIVREHERRDVLQEQHLQELEKERSEYEARIVLARQKKLSEEEARNQAAWYELERARRELERGRRGPFLIPVLPPLDR